MKPLVKFLQDIYAIRVYKDGSTFGFVWRWWNPISWIIVPIVIALSILCQGIPETFKYREYIGLRMKPWFVENPDRLVWL